MGLGFRFLGWCNCHRTMGVIDTTRTMSRTSSRCSSRQTTVGLLRQHYQAQFHSSGKPTCPKRRHESAQVVFGIPCALEAALEDDHRLEEGHLRMLDREATTKRLETRPAPRSTARRHQASKTSLISLRTWIRCRDAVVGSGMMHG